MAKEVGGVLQFKLTEPEGAWAVDLRSAPGKVTQGAQPEATTTLRLADEDLAALVKSPEAARELYMKGKLRIDGDVRVAQRLGFLKNLL